MDEPERSPADREPAPRSHDTAGATAIRVDRLGRTLPATTAFIDPASSADRAAFRRAVPARRRADRAAVVIGLLLWMARDTLRPFIVGLLLVYLLEPPVRWLVRRGLRRTLAILLVYVVAIVASSSSST